MTPKQKSDELVEKFKSLTCDCEFDDNTMCSHLAVKSAIVAVEEIMAALKVFYTGPDWQLETTMGWQYWNLVKKELEVMK